MVEMVSAEELQEVMVQLMEASVDEAKKMAAVVGGDISPDILYNSATKIYIKKVDNMEAKWRQQFQLWLEQQRHDEHMGHIKNNNGNSNLDQLKATFVKARDQLFQIWIVTLWVHIVSAVAYGMYGSPEKGILAFLSKLLEGFFNAAGGVCPVAPVVLAPTVEPSYFAWPTTGSWLGTAVEERVVESITWIERMHNCSSFYLWNFSRFFLFVVFIWWSKAFVGGDNLKAAAVIGTVGAWLLVSDIAWMAPYIGCLIAVAGGSEGCLHLKFYEMEEAMLSQDGMNGQAYTANEMYAKKFKLENIVNKSFVTAVCFAVVFVGTLVICALYNA
jgi:hypothetical protein